MALRIGYFFEERPDPRTGDPLEVASWLSAPDAAELVRAAVEADVQGFVVANGISANRHRRADLEETGRLIGYHPRDDAWHDG